MKIAVALSGGVDSAVTAYILKSQGHDVIGIFMKNWSDDYGLKGDCPWEKDQNDAMQVCEFLQIPFYTFNFEREYRERVINYFFEEYKNGRTPNPDVFCNSEIKFDLFLRKSIERFDVDKIATGHYARVIDQKEYFALFRGDDLSKDQSYFLCRLTQNELSKSIFPLGEMTKKEVRKIASDIGLPVATKKDSQGICFVGKINVREFLRSELGMKDGDIVDIETNKILGRHHGLWFYTIGQREGLGLGGGPWYVVKKDLDSNIVFVARGRNNPFLYKDFVIVEDLIWTYEKNVNKLDNLDNLSITLRYQQSPIRCISYEWKDKDLVLHLENKAFAVSPGQVGCLMSGDEVIGSGIIKA
ncbi:MAG: tRNA 2-thiouridine(34) synthase MnmA [Candidatus Dojkabacteria bacterium]|nr:tRNA 2-thiouridine(34) synthase MnmA [Candidatus Dojkabacteria bacterium]